MILFKGNFKVCTRSLLFFQAAGGRCSIKAEVHSYPLPLRLRDVSLDLVESTVLIVTRLRMRSLDGSVVVVGRFLQPWIMLEELFNGFRDGCKGGDSFVAELVSVAVLIVPNDSNSRRLGGVR